MYSLEFLIYMNVTTDVLVKICTTLGCTMDDIMEIIPDNPSSDKEI